MMLCLMLIKGCFVTPEVKQDQFAYLGDDPTVAIKYITNGHHVIIATGNRNGGETFLINKPSDIPLEQCKKYYCEFWESITPSNI